MRHPISFVHNMFKITVKFSPTLLTPDAIMPGGGLSTRCLVTASTTRIAVVRWQATLRTSWLPWKYKQEMEGFHVMSYQANIASHHTRDRHVGFLSAYYSIWEKQQNVPLLLIKFMPHCQITTDWQKYQQTHSFETSNHSMKWIESSSVFFLFFCIPCCTKENQEVFQSHAYLSAYRVVQTCCRFKQIGHINHHNVTQLIHLTNYHFQSDSLESQ